MLRITIMTLSIILFTGSNNYIYADARDRAEEKVDKIEDLQTDQVQETQIRQSEQELRKDRTEPLLPRDHLVDAMQDIDEEESLIEDVDANEDEESEIREDEQELRRDNIADAMQDIEQQESLIEREDARQVDESEIREDEQELRGNFRENGFISEAPEATQQAESAESMNQYYAKLELEVNKQNEKVQKMLQKMQASSSSQIYRVETEHALTMLDVKKTLYANFRGTETIQRSAAVRDVLLKVMQQDDITVADLAGLQNLVKTEKARLGIK